MVPTIKIQEKIPGDRLVVFTQNEWYDTKHCWSESYYG